MNRPPDRDVAELIELTNLCEALHCLPKAGGLLDQDPYHIAGMAMVIAARSEKYDREQE